MLVLEYYKKIRQFLNAAFKTAEFGIKYMHLVNLIRAFLCIYVKNQSKIVFFISFIQKNKNLILKIIK